MKSHDEWMAETMQPIIDRIAGGAMGEDEVRAWVAKHTPGPWFIYGSEYDSTLYIQPTDSHEGRGHNSVALITSGNEDDAHLIAAAPAMLEMLKRIRNDKSWRTNDNLLWPDLMATIAKATGADHG